MWALVAQVLVLFLIVYETILDFGEYRAGKIGKGTLAVKLLLLLLVSYILTDLIILRIYLNPFFQ